MNLWKTTGTIGGLTMVSRVFGFGRDMLMSRVMGASMQADAFLLAFKLPNTFRRLFGEGAFSAGFVPLFSQRLHGEGGIADAEQFSREVLAVFLPALLVFTLLFEVAMPLFVYAIASDFYADPVKFELSVTLTRLTFPYLMLISLVSLFSGVLNSLSRFTAAAFAPTLLNMSMLGAMLLFPVGGTVTAYALSIGVTVGGVLQLLLLWAAARRAGISMRLTRPRVTPGVRQFLVVVIPATLGAGVYQISQFIDTYFLAKLPVGSFSHMNYADRLNQLPLSVIGTALGTAILPTVSKYIDHGKGKEAAAVQGQAVELSMLLTLPAALALALVATPLITAFFEGGKFTLEDAHVAGGVLAILVAGLPAYVLVKVLLPGFYGRKDTKTPVKTAGIVLVANIALNFTLIPFFQIYGLALAIAACSWLNAVMLYVILYRRGHFRIEPWLWSRIARQLLAGLTMGAALWFLRAALAGWFAGSVPERLAAVGALVSVGIIVYFAVAWTIGAMNRDDILILLRKKKASVEP